MLVETAFSAVITFFIGGNKTLVERSYSDRTVFESESLTVWNQVIGSYQSKFVYLFILIYRIGKTLTYKITNLNINC